MGDVDETDGNCVGKFTIDEVDDPASALNNNNSDKPPEGTAWMTVEKDAFYYKMDHKKQGIAIIFNHQNFKNKEDCSTRHGTDQDVKKFSKCLRGLGFNVHSFKDLKKAEIQHQIDQVVNMDHTDNNCFLLIVLSHGDHDLLHAYDKSYDPNEVLWNQFTADKCPSLAGKPKLFFLQSCQGVKTDPGIKLVQRLPKTETDGDIRSYRIPIYADFLIVYATTRDHFAFRNTTDGSYFITVLCQELDKLAYTENLLTILIIVNRRVAIEFVSRARNPDVDDKKQIPYFKCSLTRHVQFVDKSNFVDNGEARSLPNPTFHSTGSYHSQ